MARPIPQRIIDSHVHLWPASAATSHSHAWMTPGHPLAKQYSIQDYLAASQSPSPASPPDIRGFVYIETDRSLGKRSGTALRSWAREPLDEIAWLRRIVDGQPKEGEGHLPEHSKLLLGIVPWAPIDEGLSVFNEWLDEVRAVAGPETFSKVRGFRYLLQGLKDFESFKWLALSADCIAVLKSFRKSGNDFSFDVGVDQRSGGVWQLHLAADMIEKVHENEVDKVIFILNHLCKPNLRIDHNTPEGAHSLHEWAECIERLAKLDNVYMKLSGAFSELGRQDPQHPLPFAAIVAKIKPWLDVLFASFPAERIMFGSDWPVCNVGGPGDVLSFQHWRAVVAEVLEQYHLSEDEKQWIWWRTAHKAYRLDGPPDP